jgi:hypothetical protein
MLIAEISAQATQIAALEDLLETDPQKAVSLILIQRDIEKLSDNVEQTQREIDRLYIIVFSTLVALVLLLAGSIIPGMGARLRESKDAPPSRPPQS